MSTLNFSVGGFLGEKMERSSHRRAKILIIEGLMVLSHNKHQKVFFFRRAESLIEEKLSSELEKVFSEKTRKPF